MTPFPDNEDAYWNNLRPNPFDDFTDEELKKLSKRKRKFTGKKIGTMKYDPKTGKIDIEIDGSEKNE